MTSYLFNGQWTTDKNERKYRHMSIIPFPVCAYAAIHYKNGWLLALVVFHFNNGLRHTHKQEMELFNMWANFLLYVSVVDWPSKGKDVLTLWRSVNIWQARRSVASLSSLARLQQINSQTGIYRFSGISAEKISESKNWLSLIHT